MLSTPLWAVGVAAMRPDSTTVTLPVYALGLAAVMVAASILAGRSCQLAGTADVLVYDAWATGEPDGARRLIEGLRDLHPDVPVVLYANGIEPNWIELAGLHRVTPLVGSPTGARLAAALEEALTLARPVPEV